jgi:hypothetical protein
MSIEPSETLRRRVVLLVDTAKFTSHVPRNFFLPYVPDSNYFLIKTYTGSPRTIPVKWRKEPVKDISSPPKEAYAVLEEGKCRG